MLSVVTLAGLVLPAPAAPAPKADFERHVVAVLGKAGCSAGSCHGSFGGKGGLRLSLFGFDPDKDYLALVKGRGGKRVDADNPEASLMLLKATGEAPHGGGKRFGVGSPQYKVLRDWIAAGGRHTPGSGAVERVEVVPAESVLTPGGAGRVSVQVRFADGTTADVTEFADLRAKDETIADVAGDGAVRAGRAGDTAVIATYRGHVVSGRVLVPFPQREGEAPAEPHRRPGSAGASPSQEAHNPIDREVFAKLGRLNIEPSGPAGDAEFLRRVTIDTTGGLPSPDEVRRFLADPRPDKRERKIDELLRHPLHAAVWATKFLDITAANVDAMDGPPELRTKKARMWHEWFRRRVAANVGYDQIVRGVLTATSREGRGVREWIGVEAAADQASRGGFDKSYAKRESLDLFWRRFEGEEFVSLEKLTELASTAFLGVRLECAQCHKHPFDRWTQSDYRGFANVFAPVRFEGSPEVVATTAEMLEARRKLPKDKAGPPLPRMREVYVSAKPRRLPHPDTGGVLPPKALGGPELPAGGDPRVALFGWMTRPDNPYFARSFVNRVWAHYFGVGLVDPVDDLSPNNPPSHPKLLDDLAAEFVRSGYDLRRLERLILTSRAYQLSSTPTDTNRRDRTNFARAYPRPLMAEAVLDVLNDAVGAKEAFGDDAPPGARAVEVATNRVRADHAARVFRVFGRPARASTCDCERASGPALPQTLFLMADPALLKKLSGGRLKAILDRGVSDANAVDELFLATLSRLPDEGEKRAALARVDAAPDRTAGLTDVLWALVNTREFILNH